MNEINSPDIDPSVAGPDHRSGRRFRRNVVAVGAALGLTLGGLGMAAAQTGQSGTTTTAPHAADDARRPGRGHHGRGPGLAAAATAIGISEDELRTALQSGQSIAQVAESKTVAVPTVIDAMVADAKTRLAEKVASGDITQAQADERAANVQERITDLVNRTGGPGRGGPGGPGHHGRGPALAAAARAIGISEDELRTALRSGQSIAQVAESKTVAVPTVIDAMVADAKTRLAEKVASGDITQAQADQKAANVQQRITHLVNRTGGARPSQPS